MTGCILRLTGQSAACGACWVVRASDLVWVPLGVTYWKVIRAWGGQGEHAHPVYAVAESNVRYASVWQYRATAENFIARNGVYADLFYTEVKGTGYTTSDGRRHLVPA